MTKKVIHLIIAPLLAIFVVPTLELVLGTSIGLSLNQVIALGLAIIMVYWWITEPIKIYQTALLPLVLVIPNIIKLFTSKALVDNYFGFNYAEKLISLDGVFSSYFHHLVFLFLGGFILAKALEKHNLHIEISKFIISIFGKSAKGIVIGFMLSTAFLSMWISNTATTIMMLPMALSVCKGLEDTPQKSKFRIGLLLALAFAANVGGTATIVGTPPNTLLIGMLKENYGIEIGFGQWMKLGVPFALIMLLVVYGVLYFLFFKGVKLKTSFEKGNKLNTTQWRVLFLFGITVALWIFRIEINKLWILLLKNQVGLSNFLPSQIKDSTIAMCMAALLFVIPAAKGDKKRLINLKDAKSIAWSILILFGGGMALAMVLKKSNLLSVIINAIEVSSTTSILFVFVVITAFALFATELMSNMALVSVLVPLVGQFALAYNYPLIQLTAAVALASSCAFMLPVATPPNAIVFSSGHLKVKTMMRAGVLINLVAIAIIFIMVRTFI